MSIAEKKAAEEKATKDNPEVIISVENVSLAYSAGNSSNVLEDIGLKLHQGEFVCLLGPSGCGKSTLLKIIAGLIPPTKGNAAMDGEVIKGPDWHRGVVFQQPPLYSWLSTRENVRFGLKMRKIPKQEGLKLADEYLHKVGLLEYAAHKPYELSGGMKQRVAIARALVNSPRVLLMDEPFGALDALTREEMVMLLRNIWRETGCTILFITHDVDEALSLGTRVLVMSRNPGQIIREFKTSFTWEFSGENPSRTRYSQNFVEMREKILDLIHKQKLYSTSSLE
ncbi:taurine transport system ATP-binding protein [Fontibacillus panacisegetis]|uniref:Taurine transport system ATP-binding protein n=1 Tax=Fontibacillus panacisegetis TaxID=670482 RepID=A0A1G7G3V5_9BACL|nr:ABC transporter ATP-binding protein [Fontibacillus panacisegetis]SDE82801.1 taurine transport system ATP-binding protein [Fontibacillus panacisegetis]